MTTTEMPEHIRRAQEGRVSTPVTEATLAEVRAKAQQLRDLYIQLQNSEEKSALLKRDINIIEAKELLDLLTRAGMPAFTLEAQGNEPEAEFKKVDVVSASIPEDRLGEALAWLDGEGRLDMVKHEYKVAFNMGEAKEAQRLEAALKRGKFEYKSKIGVLASTLTAFVRRELKAGRVVPNDLLGVYVGEKVEVALGGEKIKKRKQ